MVCYLQVLWDYRPWVTVKRKVLIQSDQHGLTRTVDEAIGILKGDGVTEAAEFNAICREVLTETSNPCTADYFEFLSLKQPSVPFDRLHARPTHDVPWTYQQEGGAVLHDDPHCQLHIVADFPSKTC